jgi:hypothetical protein
MTIWKRTDETPPEGRGREMDWRSEAFIWLVGLFVGVASGYAAIGFRLAISLIQTLLYGADDETIHSLAADLNPLSSSSSRSWRLASWAGPAPHSPTSSARSASPT